MLLGEYQLVRQYGNQGKGWVKLAVIARSVITSFGRMATVGEGDGATCVCIAADPQNKVVFYNSKRDEASVQTDNYEVDYPASMQSKPPVAED